MKTALTAALMFGFLSAIYGLYRLHEYVGTEKFLELVVLAWMISFGSALILILWAFCSCLASMILGSGERK